MQSICVFCGSNKGQNPNFIVMAENLAQTLVHRGLSMVYGGAKVGLMGVIADAVLKHGGKVKGVIPAALFPKEIPHQDLTDLYVVDSMHQRKELMYSLSDGFIALPGGMGTLDELCEILTWSLLGLHKKPCGILNVDGYFDSLIDFFYRAIEEKFMREAHRELILIDTTSEGLLKQFETYDPPSLRKWIDPDQV